MTARSEQTASEYATRSLDSIGDTAAQAIIDPETGRVIQGTPMSTIPEPPAGSVDAAILAIRRASREESGWADPWAGADDE